MKLECLIVDFIEKLLTWSALGCNSPPLSLNLQLKSLMCKALRANGRDREVGEGLSKVGGDGLHPC